MKNALLFLVFTLLSAVCALSQEIYHPRPYETMYVGQREYVAFDPSGFTPNDTVALFFDEDRNVTLAGGPALKGNFTFIVPEGALTAPDRKSSNIVVVFRNDFYLTSVEVLPVVVMLPPANETTTTV